MGIIDLDNQSLTYTFIMSYLPEEAFENCIVQIAQYNKGKC